MGQINSLASHKRIMPELLVFRDNQLLLVKGVEGDRVFWWPPGAYWMCEKMCDLQAEEPKHWIQRVLHDQIGVKLIQETLKSINFIAANHAPVFVYLVDVEGDPKPNSCRGFLEVAFCDSLHLPKVLGRDNNHGLWLHGLLDEYWSN
jgi:hypothetical protein